MATAKLYNSDFKVFTTYISNVKERSSVANGADHFETCRISYLRLIATVEKCVKKRKKLKGVKALISRCFVTLETESILPMRKLRRS